MSRKVAELLDSRARHLLRALISEYIRDGHPVGSRTLARTAGLDVSPATIRNVMADLEEIGLVAAPHSSAGRVPTAQGYRVFVDTLLEIKPLDASEAALIHSGIPAAAGTQALLSNASSLLSCHDLSDGGLAVAAAESAFAGGFGMSIDLSRVAWNGSENGWTDVALLFSESASRLLVTVRRENHETFEAIMGETCWSRVGIVIEEQILSIEAIEGHDVIMADLAELKEAWQKTLWEL